MAEKKNITISDDLRHIFPEYLLQDKNYMGFIHMLQENMNIIVEAIEFLKLYSNINGLPEYLLDELARQFNIIEYQFDDDISVKRELINGCMALHHKRGTVAAVEEVVTKVFGNAEVEEWFDYGGQPYHFRIRTSNINSTDEMIARVTDLVSKTQNVRSHLEEVIVEIMQQVNLYHACTVTLITDSTVINVENV